MDQLFTIKVTTKVNPVLTVPFRSLPSSFVLLRENQCLQHHLFKPFFPSFGLLLHFSNTLYFLCIKGLVMTVPDHVIWGCYRIFKTVFINGSSTSYALLWAARFRCFVFLFVVSSFQIPQPRCCKRQICLTECSRAGRFSFTCPAGVTSRWTASQRYLSPHETGSLLSEKIKCAQCYFTWLFWAFISCIMCVQLCTFPGVHFQMLTVLSDFFSHITVSEHAGNKKKPLLPRLNSYLSGHGSLWHEASVITFKLLFMFWCHQILGEKKFFLKLCFNYS